MSNDPIRDRIARAARDKAEREAIRKRTWSPRPYKARGVSLIDAAAESLARAIPVEDTRTLTGRILGDPIPNDPRRQPQ